MSASLVSVTLTRDELSLVVPEDAAPESAQIAGGWRALRVAGVLDFALTGVLASLAAPLADAGISIFAVSTYDTDYLLIPATNLTTALDCPARGWSQHRLSMRRCAGDVSPFSRGVSGQDD